MRRFVLVEQSEGGRREHPLREGLRIGRTGCEVPLEAGGVSRQHAIIQHFASGYSVRDLGSEGGTFVNDRRIGEPQALEDGDRIRVGSVTLIVEAVEVEEPVAPAERGSRGHVPPPDPVPEAVERRLPATLAEWPEFAPEPAPPRRLGRSAVTSGLATAVALAIVIADGVALAIQLI